ncbi:MAG: 4Fe-4S dicluster domain-containing protein [Oceanidesulfovibrio sp.]
MDFLTGGLIIALAACLAGFVWRIRRWPLGGAQISGAHEPPTRATCPKKTEHGRREQGVLRYVSAFSLDVLFQAHLARASLLRWIMHILLLAGFVGLLLMHAMDGVFSRAVLPSYQPTLDPYQWLRNLFGVMVTIGLVLAAYRRITVTCLKRTTRRDDWLALAIIAAIVVSGFLLESVQITSERVFDRMVADYFISDDPAELAGLRMVWEQEYGVVFSPPPPQPLSDAVDMSTRELLALGHEINDFACASCHSDTASAFVSYPLSRAIAPVAPEVDEAGAVSALWYAHVLLCLAGIVYLPFGKMAHVFLTPLNLLVWPTRAKPERGAVPHACGGGGSKTLRGLGMDACMHCGMCSEHCSVAASHAVLGTKDILPSEKLRTLRRKKLEGLGETAAFAFAEGSFICTECHRCTDVCPARIDLQDLWISSKRELVDEEGGGGVRAEPHRQITRFTAGQWAAQFAAGRLREPAPEEATRPVVLAESPDTFWACVQCTTCTNVCPVVAAAEDPVRELDLTPQQIMNMLRMGLKDHVLGARMVWSCVTCYKCQEHCPQGVRVADTLYELRNIASARLRRQALRGNLNDPDNQQGGGA